MLKLNFFAGVEYKNKIYFSAYNHNCLYMMDLKNKDIKPIAKFKEKQISMLHREAFIYGNMAWFIPQSGEYIVKVNLDTLEMKYFEYSYILKDEDSKRTYHAFICGKKVGRYLYLIPRSIDTLVIINTETDEISQIESVINPKQEITMDGLVEEDTLLIFFKESRYYRKIDLKTGKKFDYNLGVGIYSAIRYRENLWLLTDESKSLIKYNINKSQINNKIELGGIKQYHGTIQYDNRVIFLPFKSDSYLYLDMYNEKIIEDDIKNIKMADYYNKVTVVDSETKKIITFGNLACIGEICSNGQIIYNKLEQASEVIFDELLKVINTYNQWNELYNCFSEQWLGGVQMGLDDFLSFIIHMPDKEKKLRK